MNDSWRTKSPAPERLTVGGVLPDFSWVATATAATTMVGLIQNLLIARWLGPGGYGVLALLNAYTSFVYLLLDARAWESVTRYLPECRTRECKNDALSLVGFCFLVEVSCAVVAFAILAATAMGGGARVIGQPSGSSLLMLCAISSLMSAGEGTLRAILRVLGRFQEQAVIDITVGVTRLALVVIVLATGHEVTGVLVACLVAALLSSVSRAVQVHSALVCEFGSPLRFRFRRTGVRYLNISSLMLITSLTATLKAASDHLGEILLGYFRGPIEVGVYRMGKILLRALALVGGPAYETLYPKLVAAAGRGCVDIAGDVRRVSWSLLIIGGAISIILCLLAPLVIPVLTGSGFESSVEVLRIVVWGDLLFLCFVWAHPLIVALDRASIANIAWLLAATLWIVGSWAAVPAGGYLASSALYVISRVAVIVVYGIGLGRAFHVQGSNFWLRFIRSSSMLDLWLQRLGTIKRALYH